MNILVLADEESKYYWDYFEKSKLEDVDLIISCGDLKPQYLSFLATFSKAPVLYVHGNHDDNYEAKPPEGCICIEDDIYVFQGIRILGLGGSMRYKQGKNQYTQKEMKRRVLKIKRKAKKLGGIDILVTHSPAYHLKDGNDLTHQGFEAFIEVLNIYHPRYFVHGHVHANYGRQFVREYSYLDTKIINAFERHIIHYEEDQIKEEEE